MSDVLAYAETRDGSLRPVALEVASAAAGLARRLGGRAHAVMLGSGGASAAAEELGRHGVDRVFGAEDPAFGLYHPEASVAAIEALQDRNGYGAILFPASALGKDLAPRAAARLGRGLATEVTELEVEDGEVVVTRPLYAGKAFARLSFSASPALASLRPNVFTPEERDGEGRLEVLDVDPASARIRVREVEQSEQEMLDVAEASVVVSGGRGLGGPENWHLLEELARAVGGQVALGASRAVVDAGWRPHAEQVGQTGKTISPSLYFAIGISGAIQHQAGMRTAKTIVAINKDPEAPIFKIADYGIVGDLFEIVPRLTEEIRNARGG